MCWQTAVQSSIISLQHREGERGIEREGKRERSTVEIGFKNIRAKRLKRNKPGYKSLLLLFTNCVNLTFVSAGGALAPTAKPTPLPWTMPTNNNNNNSNYTSQTARSGNSWRDQVGSGKCVEPLLGQETQTANGNNNRNFWHIKSANLLT